MRIYYLSLDNLGFPLLALGMLMALYQLTYIEDRVGLKIVQWLMKKTRPIWGIFAILTGLYVFVRSIPTAIGWIMHVFGSAMWLGTNLADIDYRVGIGSIGVLIVVGYLAIRGWIDIRRMRKGKRNRLTETAKIE